MITKEFLLKKYERNRVIRGLIQLVPYGVGGLVDVILVETLKKIQRERTATFFEELAQGDALIDEDLLKSEDFIQAFFLTAKYALNTRRREKIQLFARLLKNSITKNSIPNLDEFEEMAGILDQLEYREVIALRILDEYSSLARGEGENDLIWTNKFWENFEKKLEELLEVPNNQIGDFMNRITRTGCYEIFTGSYYGYTGGKGKLTPTYLKLKDFIYAST